MQSFYVKEGQTDSSHCVLKGHAISGAGKYIMIRNTYLHIVLRITFRTSTVHFRIQHTLTSLLSGDPECLTIY